MLTHAATHPTPSDQTARFHSARFRKERRHNRFTLQFPVRLSFPVEGAIRELDTMSKNVGACSVLLQAQDSVPVHTPVSLTMTVRGVRAGRPILLLGDGEVVRVERLAKGAGFALAIACDRPIAEMETDFSAAS
jgi:hypothetical protein